MPYPDLILGSSSPRRLRLLKDELGITPIKVISPDIDETKRDDETVPDYTYRMAHEKALAVVDLTDRKHPIVTGDSTVTLDDQNTIEKPADEQEAFEFIKAVLGTVHFVYCGMSVWWPDGTQDTIVTKSTVEAKTLTDQELWDYVKTGTWQGRAGGCSIEDCLHFMTVIDGEFNNTIGLDTTNLKKLLLKNAV